MTITSALNTVVSTNPYLNNKADEEAIIKALQNVLDSLSPVEGLEFQEPAPGVSAKTYIQEVS
jgi:cellobiose dehydrogenase (acceptor)